MMAAFRLLRYQRVLISTLRVCSLTVAILFSPGMVGGVLGQSAAARAKQRTAIQRKAAQERLAKLDDKARRLAEFAEVMQTRTNVMQSVQSSQEYVLAARATAGLGAKGAFTDTGKALRESLLAVEAALDAQPQIQAMQSRYDELMDQKREAAHEYSVIISGWRSTRRQKRQDYNAAVSRLSQDAQRQQQSLMKSENVDSPVKLSATGKRRFEEIHAAMTNELAQLSTAFRETNSPEYEKTMRESDGSREKADSLRDQIMTIDAEAKALQASMQERRDALRAQSPEIGALEDASRQASQQHLTAIAARPDVKKAQDVIDGAEAKLRSIDQRAYTLYASILEEYPGLQEELDSLARQAGLVLTTSLRSGGNTSLATSERE